MRSGRVERDESSTMTGLEKDAGREIASAVRALQQGLGEKLVAVVLFGSQARGEAKEESRQDVQLGRWRYAVDNVQLAVENSAKTVLSLAAPVGKEPIMDLGRLHAHAHAGGLARA